METPITAKPPRYLVCVDGSKESRTALSLAAAKAAARGGSIILIYVIEPADFQSLHAVADRMRAEQYGEAEVFMSQLSKEVYDASGLTPVLLIREGTPGECIVQAAKEDPDLTMLVLGVEEQGGTSSGKLTGWLASQLGSRILIPILLVPGNLTDAQLMTLI